MVLSNRSRCMILTMVGNFDHLHPTLRLISGVLGMKSVAYLGYLCCQAEEWFARGRYSIKSRSYGRWKCSGEREEMDSHLENFWSFYLSPLFLLFWVEVRVFSLSLSLSFLIASAPVFFKEDDPHSIMIEFLEESIAWIDHSRWIGSLWRYWVLLWGNCLAKVDINTQSR